MNYIWKRLQKETNPILLYGTGNGADKIICELDRLGISIDGVFASDGFVRDRYYKKFKVMSLEEAENRFGTFTALFSFGSDRPEVLDNIKRIMKKHTLLAPEVPVANGEIFNLDFARRNARKLETVYSLLADDQSRKTFEQTVLFKLDGNVQRLFDCEVPADEPFNNILKLEQNSSFLDLGAYNGDTVMDFVKRVPNYSRVVALEPDKKSFTKLCNNTKDMNIERVNAAVSDKCQTVAFCKKSSRGSSIGIGEDIQAITIDSLCGVEGFDYIKFDIEGTELDAILGGSECIKKFRPKMRVAAYHKSTDYFFLPLQILQYRDDYQLFMRHLPSVPAWDTDFFFV